MRAFVSRVLPWLILAGLAAYIAGMALFFPDFFEDNRYNLGVARRSVLPQARSFLESSCVTIHFEKLPIPRVEDWHRGLSIILLVLYAKVVGTGSETLLRVPHVFWLGAWIALALLILRRLQARGEPNADEDRLKAGLRTPPEGGTTNEDRLKARGIPFAWCAAVFIPALVLQPWLMLVLRRAFLDDVPAATCILLAFYLLVRSDELKLPLVGAVGALCGLGFVVKDMFLLWAPLGAVLLLALGVVGHRWRSARVILAGLAVFAIGFLVVAAPRLLWTRAELGGMLKSHSSSWNIAHFYGTRPYDSHYPFWLHDDTSYASRLAVAGGLVPAIKNVVGRSGLYLKRAVDELSYLGLLFIPLLLAPRGALRWSRKEVMVLAGGVATLFAFLGFCSLGFTVATELRYLVVPVTLIVVVGVKKLMDLLSASGCRLPGWRGALRLAVLAVLFGYLYAKPQLLGYYLTNRERPPLSADMVQRLTAQLRGNESALLGTQGGIYYFSLHPEQRVLTFDRVQLAALDAAKMRRLLGEYQVGAALLTHPGSIDTMAALGYREIARSGPEVLFDCRKRQEE